MDWEGWEMVEMEEVMMKDKAAWRDTPFIALGDTFSANFPD